MAAVLFGGLFADGGAFRNGQQITAYAKGGIVGKPTIFPMANGMGLMGEAGPEAVLPLTAHVVWSSGCGICIGNMRRQLFLSNG